MGLVSPDRPLEWPDLVYAIQAALPNTELYLVGGVVRDVYLRRPVHDLDMVSPHDGRPIARRLANAFNGHYYPLDVERGVGRTLIEWEGKTWILDVAQFRGPDLLADLRDRDFTANAVASPLHGLEHVIDPLGGLADIRDKVVRLCQPSAIEHDPVRALRALRLSLGYQMRLANETKAAIRAVGDSLQRISAERIRDELLKLLGGPKPQVALTLLDTLGLLPLIFPEALAMQGIEQSPPHVFDVWRHSLGVIESVDSLLKAFSNATVDINNLSLPISLAAMSLGPLRHPLADYLATTGWPNQRTHHALLILAALAHDVGKPLTQSVGDDGRIHFYHHEEEGATLVEAWANRLALSNEETDRLWMIVRHHMRPLHLFHSGLSRRAAYRFWRDVGEAGVDICLLTMGDYLGKYGPQFDQNDWLRYLDMLRTLLEGYFHEHHELVSFQPLLNGREIMQRFNLAPGPIIGEIVAALHEAQALKEIQTPDDATAWLAEWLAQRNHHHS